jgi:hypothetical protein
MGDDFARDFMATIHRLNAARIVTNPAMWRRTGGERGYLAEGRVDAPAEDARQFATIDAARAYMGAAPVRGQVWYERDGELYE